jgi:tight adherence protein C
MTVLLSAGAGVVAILMVLSLDQFVRRDRLRAAYEAAFHRPARRPSVLRRMTNRITLPKRRWKIFKALPDFFDLLALALSSGLSFQRSFEASLDVMPSGLLKEELNQTWQMIRVGESVESAFRALTARLNEDRAAGAFALILQSLERGNPLHQVLFDQAATLRRQQMMTLEKRAQTIGLRLLLPIMIFIFPTLFVLLFGALYLSFLQSGSLF